MFNRHDDIDDAQTYRVRERIFDIGDDYWIETADGNRAYKVDGKVLRIRDTFVIEDLDGNEVAHMQARAVSIRDAFTIERPGRPDATVKQALISPFRDRWTIEAGDIGELKVSGNIIDREYTFEDDDGNTVAETSKRWFRIRDTYGVRISRHVDAPLILAATVAIDQMAHDD